MEKQFLKLFTKLYGHHYPVIDMDIRYEKDYPGVYGGRFIVTLNKLMYVAFKEKNQDFNVDEFFEMSYEYVVNTGKYLGKRANIYPYLGS